MNKIPTLFIRDPANMSRVTREVHPDAAWVIEGEGVPTVKKDGTNILIGIAHVNGVGTLCRVEKRRNPTREEKAIGVEPGYVACPHNAPENKHIWAAINATDFSDWPIGDWSCEALGPKIQGGVESSTPCLYPFSWRPETIDDSDWVRSLDGLHDFLREVEIEGIVWHHPDGRMAKLKRKDLGLPWPIKG